MAKHKFTVGFAFLCLLFTFSVPLSAVQPPQSQTKLADVQTDESNLRVHFIDVGAGLAVLIETPGDHKHIMIDGAYQGRKGLNQYIANFIDKDEEPIDIVMVTHADQDHYYGFIKIFKDYEIHQFWNTGYTSATLKVKKCRWQKLLKCVEKEEEEYCEVYMPLNDWMGAGDKEIIDTGESNTNKDDIVVQYLNVDNDPPTNDPCSTTTFDEGKRRNNASLVIKLIYGDVSFLFTGDINGRKESQTAEIHDDFIFSEEFELYNRHKNDPTKYSLEATVLQVPHHGSDGSNSLPFLKAVKADWAVIPAGDDYGHPTEGVLRRLGKSGIADDHILRTDEGDDQTVDGDEPPGDDSFIFETDGKKITKIHWVKT